MLQIFLQDDYSPTMPLVHFLNEAITIDAPVGMSIYEISQKANINLHRGFLNTYQCGGKGLCLGAGCKVWINAPSEHAVSKKSHWKERLRPQLHGKQRLACQCIVSGQCEVRTQPGATTVEQSTQWDPDPREHKWQKRLAVTASKKKPNNSNNASSNTPETNVLDNSDSPTGTITNNS